MWYLGVAGRGFYSFGDSLSRLSRVEAVDYVRQVCDFVDVSASTFSVAEFYSIVTVSDSGEPLCGFLCYFRAGLQSISHVLWSPSLCLLCLGTLLDLHCTGGWFSLASVGLCRFVPFLFAPSDLSLFGCTRWAMMLLIGAVPSWLIRCCVCRASPSWFL